MTDDLQPYAPVASESLQQEEDGRVATSAVWFAYLLTPPIAPLLLAMLVFVFALILSDPEDTGTPIGIILVPLFLATGGILLSYLITLVVGMPTVFILRNRNKLSLSNLLWACALVAVVLGTLFVILQLVADGGPGSGTYSEIVVVMCFTSIAFGLIFMLQAVAFWMVMRKFDRKRRT